MTTAPPNLRAARALLLEHLDIHENSTAYPADLDPAEVGIVGDPAHRGGYHCGRDRVDLDDYSVRESRRDRDGLSDYACALDIGSWSMRIAGKTHDLASMSLWLVAQCKAGAPDTGDIREIIYSPDGTTVRRWDRLGIRTTGDSSHRWHTHISYHRDAIRAGRDQTAVIRRYLTEIGLLAGEEADMAITDDDARKIAGAVAGWVYQDGRALYSHVRDADRGVGLVRTELAALRAEVARLSGADVDVPALAAALAPGLVTAIREELGDVDEERLAGAVESGVRRVLGSLDGTSPAPAP